ncbi:MAG: polymer-forming cytoskeletal protein [Pseudomonadota bacterium]
MFESKKQPALHTLIGEGTLIQGNLQFPGGVLQIDGQVQGDVVSTGERPSVIQVGEKASVTGRLQATHVVINGRVTGPVQADGLLELKSRAAIVGSVKYQALEMQQGATIEGELHPIHAQSPSPPALESPSDEPALVNSP